MRPSAVVNFYKIARRFRPKRARADSALAIFPNNNNLCITCNQVLARRVGNKKRRVWAGRRIGNARPGVI